MSRSAFEYRKQLQSLLPKGKLWNRREDSVLTKLLYGISDELVRIEGRTENLVLEKLLDSSSELLEEHEYDFGIPEKGESLQPTLIGRRKECKSKLLTVGQQNKEYYIEICSAFGYNVIITEFIPAWAGIAKAGDPCGDQWILFLWKINIDVDSVVESIEVNLDKLINKINKVKPLHTHVLFDWYNASFNRSFNRAFRRFYHYDNYWVELEFNRCFDSSFTNCCDYYGINYTGSYNYGMSIDFDRCSGGAFSPDNFGFKNFANFDKDEFDTSFSIDIFGDIYMRTGFSHPA